MTSGWQPHPPATFFVPFGDFEKQFMSTASTSTNPPLVCWNCHERALGTHFCPSCGKLQRELSLKRSSELNDAYRALRDPVARVEYLLGIEGTRKEGEHKQQAPPELLEEVFELNESLDELREAKASGGDLAALKSRLESAEKHFQEKLGEVDAQLQSAAKEWDAALEEDAATRKKIMARLNDLLNRRSYIRNLVTNVQKELL